MKTWDCYSVENIVYTDSCNFIGRLHLWLY